MTRDALKRVRDLLGEVDDVIYRDCRERGLDFTYTEEEVTLTTILDEAQAQASSMMEAIA